MSLRSWWHAYRMRRARRYLHTHAVLARDILRRDPDLASHLVLQATANTPDRKTMEFPVLTSMGYGGQHGVQTTLPKATPGNLRRFSEMPPSRRAINAITDPIVELPWQIDLVPPDDHDRTQPLPKPTAEQHARILAATRMFKEPNTDSGWRTFIEEVAEDIVCFGAGSIETAPTHDPQRPYLLWSVDTQSIRINAHWDGDPRTYRYAQALGSSGMGISTQQVVQLRDEDLLYVRLNPRAHTPFGLGYLEVAFAAVNAWLGAFDFAERRASNSTPNYVIFLGEHMTMTDVQRWRFYWENEIEGRGKIPIIGGGTAPNVLPLSGEGEDPLWLKWQETLLRVIAIAFGLSPFRLGLERDVNRNTSESSMINDWSSISPVAGAIQQALTAQVLHKRLGWTDLQFTWELQESDTLRQAQVTDLYYRMDAVLIDEIREIDGKPPLPDGRGQLTMSEYQARAKALYAPQPTAMDDGTTSTQPATSENVRPSTAA